MMLPPALATGRRFTTDAVIGESLNTVDENRNRREGSQSPHKWVYVTCVVRINAGININRNVWRWST